MKRARRGRRQLEADAAAVGLRVTEANMDATLPAVRCSAEQRKRAKELADAAGISLAEHIRRSATS